MPLYELFCLSRPAAGRHALSEMIKYAGQAILTKGGVLTDVTFYGEQQLAYPIRNTTGQFDKADIWQVQFMVAPPVLDQLQHNLAVDERVLRYIVQKQQALPSYPNTHRVKSFADRLTQAEQVTHQQ